MIYKDFQGIKLSQLGFGTMRLPTLENGEINQPLFEEMVDYAIKNGVNYFDTAYPYHGGKSEIDTGLALKKYQVGQKSVASAMKQQEKQKKANKR